MRGVLTIMGIMVFSLVFGLVIVPALCATVIGTIILKTFTLFCGFVIICAFVMAYF